MEKIKNFRLENFRVFRNNTFKFRPFTFITGPNSSGKSSVFKALILLKQSFEVYKREALIFSDTLSPHHYLGTYENVLNDKNKNLIFEIELENQITYFIEYEKNENDGRLKDFKIIFENQNIYDYSSNELSDIYSQEIESNDKIIEKIQKELAELKERKYENKKSEWNLDEIENEIINLFNNKQKLVAERDKIIFQILKSDYDSISPIFNLDVKSETNENFRKEYYRIKKNIKRFEENLQEKIFEEEILSYQINDLVEIIKDKESKKKRAIEEIDDIKNYENSLRRDKEKVRELNIDNEKLETRNKKIKSTSDLENRIKEIQDNPVNEGINNRIVKNIFVETLPKLNFEYIEGIRANTRRLYSKANEGTGFNDLINNYLIHDNKAKIKDFIEKWMQKFEIAETFSIEPYENTVSVIKLDNRNLADLGYGISQLLPIILKISEAGISEQDFVLIEEPEINLHPKFQSKLVELFFDAHELFNLYFIIETHSEYLIHKILQLSVDNDYKCNKEDIILYYIDNKENISEVKEIVPEQNGEINYSLFGSGFFDEMDKIRLLFWNSQNKAKLNQLREVHRTNYDEIIDEFHNHIFNTIKISRVSGIEEKLKQKFGENVKNDSENFNLLIFAYSSIDLEPDNESTLAISVLTIYIVVENLFRKIVLKPIKTTLKKKKEKYKNTGKKNLLYNYFFYNGILTFYSFNNCFIVKNESKFEIDFNKEIEKWKTQLQTDKLFENHLKMEEKTRNILAHSGKIDKGKSQDVINILEDTIKKLYNTNNK